MDALTKILSKVDVISLILRADGIFVANYRTGKKIVTISEFTPSRLLQAVERHVEKNI